MIEISPRQLSQEFPCPYIQGRIAQNEFFLAFDFNEDELDRFFELGWRKFGYYFFRPTCFNCRACNPIRVLVQKFMLSRSQVRVKNKNSDLIVKFSPLAYSDEIFDLYLRHSVDRFNSKKDSKKEFIESFYNCPESSIQAEYYLGSELIAVGFIDRSKKALNSVYFVYNPAYGKRSLGSFGVIKEVEFASSCGLPYYYLGYHIRENHFMAYKDKFRKHEVFNWESGCWNEGTEGWTPSCVIQNDNVWF